MFVRACIGGLVIALAAPAMAYAAGTSTKTLTVTNNASQLGKVVRGTTQTLFRLTPPGALSRISGNFTRVSGNTGQLTPQTVTVTCVTTSGSGNGTCASYTRVKISVTALTNTGWPGSATAFTADSVTGATLTQTSGGASSRTFTLTCPGSSCLSSVTITMAVGMDVTLNTSAITPQAGGYPYSVSAAWQ